MNTSARFSTRFLLFGEMILGWFSMAWAVSAIAGSGLWAMILGTAHGIAWAWFLFGVAFSQFVVAFVEMFHGRNWTDKKLQIASEIRHFLGVISVIAWVSLMFQFFSKQPGLQPAIYMQSFGLILANTVVFVNNKRLALLLDPEVPTEQLRTRLIAERDRGKAVL